MFHTDSEPRKRVSASALHGVSLLRIERSAMPRRMVKEPFSVALVVQGHIEFWQRGQVHSQGRGALLLSQPGDVHRGVKVHDPVSLHIVSIAPELVEAARQELGAKQALADLPVVLPVGSPEAAACFELQRAMFSERDPLAQREALDHALAQLTRLSQRGRGARVLAPEPVRRAQSYMRDQLDRQLNLGDIAAEAGADSFALIRAFRRHVGLSPYEWLTQTRVQRACELLARGAKPSEAAMQVGFYDQSQLHRHFRRIVGVTPGAYAKAFNAR